MYHEILRKSATCCEERAHHRREWCKRVGGNQEGLQDYTAPEDEEQERKMLSEAEDVVENARIVMDGSSIDTSYLSLSLSVCLPPSLSQDRSRDGDQDCVIASCMFHVSSVMEVHVP